MKNGELAVAMLPKVWRVLCALDPKGHAYQKPLLEQMLLLKHHQYTDSPTWYLIKNHFHLFNEEVGEVSLSVLSRLHKPVLNKRPDIEHWDKAYKLSKVYQSVDDSVMTSRDKNNTRSKPIKMKNHEGTMQRTLDFLNDLITAAGEGTFTMITGPKKVWDSKRYRADAWKKEKPVRRTQTIPMFKKDISQNLLKRWKLVAKDTESNWAAQNVGASWPEYGQGLDVAADGSDPDEGDDEGDAMEGDDDDNGDEGDDDGVFQLPGDSDDDSESDSEEAGRRQFHEMDAYMSELVDAVDDNVSGRAVEDHVPEDAHNDDVEDAFNGSRKRSKRPGR